jgi:hypothetical protein
MEDTTQINPAKAGEIAQKIVSLLINEDSGTRGRAIRAAMTLLGEKPIAGDTSAERAKAPLRGPEASLDLGQFFNRGDKLRPSDNAQLCAAYHYSLYGTAAFSLDEIRAIAKNAGVVLPDRLDMTLSSATHAGKKLFQSAGRGTVKPTAAAGVAFNERWSVKPGRQEKAADSIR